MLSGTEQGMCIADTTHMHTLSLSLCMYVCVCVSACERERERGGRVTDISNLPQAEDPEATDAAAVELAVLAFHDVESVVDEEGSTEASL